MVSTRSLLTPLASPHSPPAFLASQDFIIDPSSWPWVEAKIIRSTGGGFFGSDVYVDLEFIDGTVERGVHGSEVRLHEGGLDEDSALLDGHACAPGYFSGAIARSAKKAGSAISKGAKKATHFAVPLPTQDPEQEEANGAQEGEGANVFERIGLGGGDLATLPEHSAWVPLHIFHPTKFKNMLTGQLALYIAIRPKAEAEKRPSGKGRSQPNQFPKCPAPVGRPKLSANPIELVKQSIGPEAFERVIYGCCCFLCCILVIGIVGLAQPVLNFGTEYPKVVFWGAVGVISTVVLCYARAVFIRRGAG
jgi:hypothetical protein